MKAKQDPCGDPMFHKIQVLERMFRFQKRKEEKQQVQK